MNQGVGLILCIGYILGLLASLTSLPNSGYGVLICGLLAAIIVPRLQKRAILKSLEKKKKKGKKNQANQLNSSPIIPQWVWLAAGLIGLFASFYYQFRIPEPTANDISQLLANNQGDNAKVYIVKGELEGNSHLTCAGRAQFWLNVNQVSEIAGENGAAKVNQLVSGKVYVTAPLLQATGLYPGIAITVTGSLYQPKPPANPGSFDFAAYIKERGAFAGMFAKQLNFSIDNPPWGLWIVRERIVKSFVRSLDVPAGPLVAAMVLGKEAVDIPCDVREQIRQVGLSHILAASGFQVSLILSFILALTVFLPQNINILSALISLFIYVGLTDIAPSILRAVLMGLAVLIAQFSRKKLNPLGSLVGVATILLLINPMWIKDVGFQLSFLATLGLLVTASAIQKRLDFIPVVISSLIAVPVAATIWTLPLQLYYFKAISPYSILINIIAAPFVTIISLGGMVVSLIAVISPDAGSMAAWFLLYPVQGLLTIVNYCENFLGNAISVGSITIWQLLILYGLIGLVWYSEVQRKKREEFANKRDRGNWLINFFGKWWVAGSIAVALIIIPVWQAKNNLFQITVIATSGEPVMTIQEKGEILLFNSGSEKTVKYNILPFLKQQAINQIDWAIAPALPENASNGWQYLLDNLPIQVFYDIIAINQKSTRSPASILPALQANKGIYLGISKGQGVKINSVEMRVIDPEIPVIKWQINQQTWLLLGDNQTKDWQNLATVDNFGPIQVLCWPGKALSDELLAILKPKVAIAYSRTLDPDMDETLRQRQVEVFWTGQDGAIQWTPNQGFKTMLDSGDNNANL